MVVVPPNGCVILPANATFNGAAYGSNCQSIIAQFQSLGHSWYDPWLFYVLGGVIFLCVGLLGARIYWERWARGFWRFNGVVAVLRMEGKHGLLGKLQKTVEEKLWLFEGTHSGLFGKGKYTCPILAVPGSITQMGPEDGGVSFALIDGDRGAAANPQVEAWANVALSDLSDSHDWRQFVYNWKLKEIEQSFVERFPDLGALKADTPIYVPSGNQLVAVKVSELAEKGFKNWYEGERSKEQGRLQEGRQLKAEIEAIMAGATSYKWGQGEDNVYQISLGRPSDLEQSFTKQLAVSQDDYAQALLQGRHVVETRYVARMMEGTPWPADILAMEEKWKREVMETLTSLQKYGPLIALFGALGLCILLSTVGLAVLLGVVH